MAIRTLDNRNSIRKAFATLATNVSMSNSLNQQDINICAENFFRDIFNYIYTDRHFINLNNLSQNYIAIDIGDDCSDIAIQITSNKKRSKATETINKYKTKKAYRKVKMLYCVESKSKRTKGFESEINGEFEFEELDLTDLLNIICSQHGDTIDTISKYINREIFPNEFKFKENQDIYPYSYFIDNDKIQLKNFILRKVQIINKSITSLNLIDLLNTEYKIALLASAGMGKTFELKQTAFEVLNNEVGYPIYIELRDYTGDKDIEFYLPQNWNKVNPNQLYLFFDGYDELIAEHRSVFQRKISQFSKSNDKIHIVVSSRTNFYNAEVDTLNDFTPVVLCQLSYSDIVEYVNSHFEIDGNIFITEVHHANYDDLAYNPFFLNALIENYIQNNCQLSSRHILLNDFLVKSIKSDQAHFKTTIDVDIQIPLLVQILQKVALSMQLMYVRKISENDLLKIISSTDFKLINYSGIFKKINEVDNYWTFEHNNFLELLCAQKIKDFTKEEIIKLITYPGYSKLNPNWSNIIVFLIGILEKQDPLLDQIIKWFVENDKEVLIKAEKEKIDIETRTEILKQVFNYYKKKNIWLSSNNFSTKELAQFCQSKESIDFIISEVLDNKNERRVRLNGLMVLRHFSQEQISSKDIIVSEFIKLIENENQDSNFIHDVIYAISDLIKCNKDIITQLLRIVGKRKSAYIRAAMYHVINKGDFVNDFIEYYIEGLGILEQKNHILEDRESTNLYDESFLLYNGIKKTTGSNAISKLIKHYGSNYYVCEGDYQFNEFFSKFIDNCIVSYKTDELDIGVMYSFLQAHLEHYHFDKAKLTFQFFIQTFTQKDGFKFFLDKLITNELNANSVQLSMCYFLNEENIAEIVSKYNSGKLRTEVLSGIYQDCRIINNSLSKVYLQFLKKSTDIIIEEPAQIDYNNIRKIRNQQSFDLLFNIEELKIECIKVFETESNLTKDYLFGFRKGKYFEIENDYYESALRILRDFCRESGIVQKAEVVRWFTETERVRYYTIQQISTYLKGNNNETLNISDQQKQYIYNWCNEELINSDFKNAITPRENKSFSINNLELLLAFYIQRFELEISEEYYLDMLSFTFDASTLSFDFLVKRISKDKLEERITVLLKEKIIRNNSVYQNLVNYVFENNIESLFEVIFETICNTVQDEYLNYHIFDTYFKNNIDKKHIKRYIDKFDFNSQFELYRLLIQNGDKDFAALKLIELDRNKLDIVQLKSHNYLLISCGNILGLIYTIEWIKQTKKSPFSRHDTLLSNYSNIESLSYLLQLLELLYNTKIEETHSFDRTWPLVTDAIQYLALSNNRNFAVVVNALNTFIEERKGNVNDIEFLFSVVQRIQEEYFSKNTYNLTLREALSTIKQLAI